MNKNSYIINNNNNINIGNIKNNINNNNSNKINNKDNRSLILNYIKIIMIRWKSNRLNLFFRILCLQNNNLI